VRSGRVDLYRGTEIMLVHQRLENAVRRRRSADITHAYEQDFYGLLRRHLFSLQVVCHEM
jgi:hypothetical protein